VPTSAVQRGPNGTFVYVVDAESKGAVRPVTVNQQDDTGAVISSGLNAEERVVTTGFTRLSNGTRVRVQPSDGQPQPDAAPSATPRGPEAAAPEGKSKREGGEGEGKRRRRSEAAPGSPGTPSAKQ
jgi:multidrug efflux system membrane fusion protein